MTRWLWAAVVAVVIVVLVVFFWPASNRTALVSPVAQSPSPATPPTTVAGSPTPASSPVAQATPTSTPAAQTTPTPTPTLTPAAQTTLSPTPTSTPIAQTTPTPTPASTPVAQTTPMPSPVPAATMDQVADADSHVNDMAATELESLKSGFGAKEVITALNDSVVNFALGSADMPAAMTAFLQKAGADLKQVPRGHLLEIAGYTDNTGDAAENLALSQRRAESVRAALIKYGADPDMLIAKGYGSADSIASNDTPEGRLRNRRIEYHIIMTP